MGKKKKTEPIDKEAFEQFSVELEACNNDIFKWIETCGQPVKNHATTCMTQ